MLRTLFAPSWKIVGPTPEGMNILRATSHQGHDLYAIASPYRKMPILMPKTRWTWTRQRPGDRPEFQGSPYVEHHVRNLSTWFFEIPSLYQIGFAPSMGIFLDFSAAPMNDEEYELRVQDALALHEETFWHHADWRSRSRP